MAGEGKAFNEVRALLSKLDRSIDEARSKRVGPKNDRPAPVLENDRPGSRIDLDREIGRSNGSSPAQQSPAQPQPARSQYGRARPLNRPGDAAVPSKQNENAWRPSGGYDDMTIG